MNSQLIITLLVFLFTFSIVLSLFMYLRSRQERKALLEKLQNDGLSPLETTAIAAAGQVQQAPLLTRLSLWMGSRFKPKSEAEISHNRLLFAQAGYRGANTLLIFQGAKLLMATGLPLVLLLAQNLILHLPGTQMAVFVLCLAVIGYGLPLRWVKMAINRRKARITEGFPDALDLLTVCVEAGMGLDSAINRVAIEMADTNTPISEEFKMLGMEIRAGRTRRDALKNMAARTDLEDVNSLATLIIQTDKFGTSVGPALRIHADSMRTKRFQRAEEIAAKIPTKLIFPLMFFIFPCLFIVMVAPAVIQAIRAWKGM
jgi:tight adherence protein C